MRLGHLGPQSANYYGRNPVVRTAEYDAQGVSPHAATTRNTYTVPTGKLAYVESLYCLVVRITAATAASRVGAVCNLDPSGGEPAVDIIRALLLTNAVGDNHGVVLASGGYLAAGDVLTLVTSDASTGGTVDYQVTRKLTEFEP